MEIKKIMGGGGQRNLLLQRRKGAAAEGSCLPAKGGECRLGIHRDGL